MGLVVRMMCGLRAHKHSPVCHSLWSLRGLLAGAHGACAGACFRRCCWMWA